MLRSVFQGHVRFAMPHTLIELTPERVALYLRAGTAGRRFAGAPLHAVDDLSAYDWSLREHVWRRTQVLRLSSFGAAHSVDVQWDAGTGAHLCWYVNLQEPLRRTALGFDTRDQALDLVVRPDRTWAWKDEDHLEVATERGRFTPQQAAAIRAEGERVLESVERWGSPFCDGWESWRPSVAWPVPTLPRGWDVVTG